MFSTHVNLVCRSLVSIVWLSCILPEIHGQEENLSLEDETEPGVTGEVPAVSVAGDVSRGSDPRIKSRRPESESRQFVVYGADFSTRVALASLAEDMRKALIKMLGREDEQWEHSIVIQLRE